MLSYEIIDKCSGLREISLVAMDHMQSMANNTGADSSIKDIPRLKFLKSPHHHEDEIRTFVFIFSSLLIY